MTFGEMLKLTNRLNQILGASKILKKKRLLNLKHDLETLYAENGAFTDVAAYWMHKRVCEEIELCKEVN